MFFDAHAHERVFFPIMQLLVPQKQLFGDPLGSA